MASDKAVIKHVVKVEIPMKKSLVYVRGTTTEREEQFFVSMRDKAKEHAEKKEFDRARALMKWAACCDGKLAKMISAKGRLSISFEFERYDDMMEFVNNLDVNVWSSIMQ